MAIVSYDRESIYRGVDTLKPVYYWNFYILGDFLTYVVATYCF